MSDWPGTVIDDEAVFAAPKAKDAAPARAQTVDVFPGEELPADDPRLVNGGYETIGGFADELPREAVSRMSPEDEAKVREMLLSGADASAVREFVASKGFQMNNLDSVLAARDQTGQVNKNSVYELKPVALPEEDGTGAALRGFGDTVTFGTLPKLGALAGATADWLSSDTAFADAFARHLDENNGIIQGDERDSPYLRMGGQLAGGLVLPAGIEGVGFRAGQQALRAGATIGEARAAASIAVRNRLAGVGGGYGVAHGVGSADSFGEAATGALTEGAVGAAGGFLAGAAGQVLAPRSAARAATARAAPIPDSTKFAQAAERQGIEYLPADVQGNQGKQIAARMASGIANVTLGGIPLSEAAQRIVGTAKAARDRIAQAVGVVTDGAGVGQAVQRGARQFMTESERRGAALYDAIPIPPEQDAVLSSTRSALTELTAGMKSNPQLSKLVAENPRLKAMLDALTPKEKVQPATPEQPGGMGFGVDIEPIPGTPARSTGVMEGGKLSWQDLKRFRTIIGEITGQPTLSPSLSNKALRRLYSALSDDMRATAQKSGDRALTAFDRANQYWRGRQGRIDNVLSDVLGDDLQKGAENAAKQINTWATRTTADSNRLGRLIRSLPTDEADTVRASIISRLGRASSGRQDQGGEVFSPAEFATQWDKLDPRAKNILFQGEHRKALDDVARVMSGMKASSQFANSSKTSIGTNAIALITWAFANPLAAGGAAGAQIGFGKLLSSTRIAKWLAAAPKKPNSAAFVDHVSRLSGIAKAEPALANDIFGLQARLGEAFTTGAPTRLAAQEGDDEARVANGQDGSRQPPAEGIEP